MLSNTSWKTPGLRGWDTSSLVGLNFRKAHAVDTIKLTWADDGFSTWSSLSIWLPRNFNPPHLLRIFSPCCFKSTYHQVSVCSWYRNDRASCVERKLIRSINSRKQMLSRGSIPDVITVHNLRKSPSLLLFKNTWVSFNVFVKLCSPCPPPPVHHHHYVAFHYHTIYLG